MKIQYSPSRTQLDEILSWLRREREDTGSSFYSNQVIIERAYKDGNILVYEKNAEAVGFLIWSEHKNEKDLYIDLDIMAIRPDYRGQSIGSEFYNMVEKYFIKRGIVVVKLFCSPASSESFWKAMEFQKYPDTGYAEHSLTYYKPLKECNESNLGSSFDRFELWNVENYRASDFVPKWTWNIKNNFKSIIQPCNSDWKLRLVLNNEIVRESKVKYFTSKNHEIEIGSFLYINNEMLVKIKRGL